MPLSQTMETNQTIALIRRAWTAIESIAAQPGLRVLLRIVGALPGGYAFTASLVALLTVLLTHAGLPRSEAVVSASMLGFVFYLLVLLWAFSVRSLVRLWLLLAGGTVLALGLLAALA